MSPPWQTAKPAVELVVEQSSFTEESVEAAKRLLQITASSGDLDTDALKFASGQVTVL